MTNANAEVTHGVVEIESGHRICAQLLLELHRHTHDLPAGTIVRLYACDPVAPIDLAAWCHLTGYHYRGPTTQQPDTARSTSGSDRCPATTSNCARTNNRRPQHGRPSGSADDRLLDEIRSCLQPAARPLTDVKTGNPRQLPLQVTVVVSPLANVPVQRSATGTSVCADVTRGGVTEAAKQIGIPFPGRRGRDRGSARAGHPQWSAGDRCLGRTGGER